jgi:glycosyltransferase involved in cell wall biosynthesis
VAEQSALAMQQHRIEAVWLNEAQCRQVMREYELADTIVVASEYVWESFVAAGVAEHKLRRRELRVHPRFTPAATRPDDGVFRIVYAGNLTVMKGIPVLIEAFARLPGRAELTLVGGWGTRGMRRYIERCLRRDPRIRVGPGDPLPHLQRADVYVHPSYSDGLALAPMEALACGVPVIVTEDTGMKEHVRDQVNGYIVPTGSVDAIVERLEALRRRGGAGAAASQTSYEQESGT